MRTISISLLLGAAMVATPSYGKGCNSLTAEYRGSTSFEQWGKVRAFATFEITSTSKNKMSIPLVPKLDRIMVHGDYAELQARSASNQEWDIYAPALEHYLPPNTWADMSAGGGITVNLNIDQARADPKKSSLHFRVRFKEAGGCDFFSDEFKVTGENSSP